MCLSCKYDIKSVMTPPPVFYDCCKQSVRFADKTSGGVNRIFTIVIGITLLLCAGASQAASGSLATVLINGASYIPIYSLSSQKGFQYQWDPLLQNAIVRGNRGAIKFHVGSEYILNQGALIKLKDKVRFFQGIVVAPVSASEYLEGLSAPFAYKTPAVSQALYGTRRVAPLGVHRIQRIVIDPGHGGRDYGAISPRGTVEKRLVLDIARMVRDELKKEGLEVVMTRNSDVFIPLAQRAHIANKKDADFFVSIHANASESRSLRGFEIYYLSEATDDLALALQRAENSSLKTIVWDLKETENRRESIHIAKFVTDSVLQFSEVSDHRIRSAQFYVLKWTECPAVLVETGYLTNSEDEHRLNNPSYRRQLASGIVRGLLDYKNEFESTDGFTD